MLTKEECVACLNYQMLSPTVRKCFEKLINEHFDNPPLKFEELKHNMWVWDNCWQEYFEISEVYQKTKEFDILIHQNAINMKRYKTIKFEENRFYRRQLED